MKKREKNKRLNLPLGVLAEARRRSSTRASWSTCLVVVSFDVYTPPVRPRRRCVDRGAVVCSSALPARRNFARLHSHCTVRGTSYCILPTHTIFFVFSLIDFVKMSIWVILVSIDVKTLTGFYFTERCSERKKNKVVGTKGTRE